jgi:hypothetical protein
MFNQKSIIILFVDRNRFQLYGGNLTGVVTLEIPEVLIHDMDVIGKDGLYTQIKQWLKQYNIIGSQLVVILSEVSYFEKIFSPSEHTQVETDVLKFFDTVPYETIWTKVYAAEKGKRGVAISKSLYEAIHQGFALQGLPTKAVIPAFALGPEIHKRTMDNALGEYVMNNLDSLMKFSLLDSQELSQTVPLEKREEGKVTPKQSSNLPLLIGVFGVLLSILVIVVVMQLST